MKVEMTRDLFERLFEEDIKAAAQEMNHPIILPDKVIVDDGRQNDPYLMLQKDFASAGVIKMRDFQGGVYAEFPKFDAIISQSKNGWKVRLNDNIKSMTLFCDSTEKMYKSIKQVNDFSFFCMTPLLLDSFADAIKEGDVKLTSKVITGKTSASILKQLGDIVETC